MTAAAKPARTPMSMPDRVFLSFDTDRVFTHVSLVMTFQLPDHATDFTAELVARLRDADGIVEPFTFRAPARRRRRWEVLEPADIDLHYHVRHSALPAPGSTRQLETAVARLHSVPLDPARPLWECHVIDGLADHRFAVCVKVHHALMDGTALVGQLARMTSPDPADGQLRPPWTLPLPQPGSPPGTRVGPAVVRDLARGARRFLREARHPTDPAFAVPLTGPRSPLLNGRLSRQRGWATAEFDATAMRALARRSGGSLNEVFLVALSGALRRYLGERGELPRRGLIAGVPVASRSGTADPRHDAGAMILVNLFTDLADPLDRLRAVLRSSRIAKRHLDAIAPAAADSYAVLTFGPFMVQELTRLSGRVRAPFNVTVSNVAGPRDQRYLLGAAQRNLFAAANLGHGQRLNMTVLSIGDRIGVGFTGCADAFGDIERLAGYLAAAVEELDAAARG